jgi:hypothetical protein
MLDISSEEKNKDSAAMSIGKPEGNPFPGWNNRITCS